jgi:DNA-binding XRE family transcriptional regulator
MLKLEQYRKEKGMSIRQLSLLTGISRTYLTAIEEDIYNPSLNIICSLCRVFLITPNDLIPEEMYK